MGEEKRTLSCTDCGVLNCHKRNASIVSGVLFDRKADRRRHRRNDSAL